MKAVILAGGTGSRLSEETHLKPKPMIEIGGRPILWHIMKIYSAQGVHDFIICLGYKGYLIKEYFANYFLHMSDVTFHMRENRMQVHQHKVEPWRVTLVDTGDQTMTGGRIKAVQQYLDDESFCLTYGDGVANIDIQALLTFHREQGRLATLTAVQPVGRFGSICQEGHLVTEFMEKPLQGAGWISGGFFVLSPKVIDYIDGPETVWERDPLSRLSDEGQLVAYSHKGFWHPMDTLRDKHYLEELWNSGSVPWKVWE